MSIELSSPWLPETLTRYRNLHNDEKLHLIIFSHKRTEIVRQVLKRISADIYYPTIKRLFFGVPVTLSSVSGLQLESIHSTFVCYNHFVQRELVKLQHVWISWENLSWSVFKIDQRWLPCYYCANTQVCTVEKKIKNLTANFEVKIQALKEKCSAKYRNKINKHANKLHANRSCS